MPDAKTCEVAEWVPSWLETFTRARCPTVPKKMILKAKNPLLAHKDSARHIKTILIISILPCSDGSLPAGTPPHLEKKGTATRSWELCRSAGTPLPAVLKASF